MSTPKTVTKVLNNGVTYTSNVDKCEYTMKELCRGALRDVAKFVMKEFKSSYYGYYKKHSGRGGKVPKAKVWSSENTQYPRVQIGLKKGKVDGFYGLFQELGTSKTPKQGFLTHAVEDNVATIIEIESKYLSALEDEAMALKMIDSENDYDIDEV